MITLTKSGNTITFAFDENSGYLQNGTIDVPVNALSLITDSSEMATFRKSASNDIFISARYEDFGMTKAQLEAWYKANMVDTITEEEIQDMIDTSTANYFDNAVYDSGTTMINFYHGNTVKASIDASQFVIDGMIDDVRIETISGVTYLVIDFNTASGKEDIQIPLTDIFDPSNYYTKQEVDAALSGKADTTAVTEAISEAVSGKADTTAVTESIAEATSGKVDTSTFETYSGSVETALSGKQDTLSAGTNITISGNVISAEGGGKAVSGGTNISITTGETADTINCTLPISYGGVWGRSINLGRSDNKLTSGDYNVVQGAGTEVKNNREMSCCSFNVSNYSNNTFGGSGNTLFSVGNGTADNARHNAFEIRQNGDIYLTKDGQDVKLQDQLGGGISSGDVQTMIDSSISGKVDTTDFNTYSGTVESRLTEDEEVTAAGINAVNDKFGGLKLMKITQAAYDALTVKDNNVLYIIIN